MQKLNIEGALKKYGFTKKAAAEKAGINYSYFSLATSGLKNISVEKLLSIANALEIPINEFFEDEDTVETSEILVSCPYCHKSIKVTLSQN